MMRFDRFTERAQDAAMRAYEILQRYGHNQVDIEHVLLALLEQPEGTIPRILENLGADIHTVQSRLDEVLKASPKMPPFPSGAVGQVYITPRFKRVIDLADEEAKRLKDEYVSTEHIFLAIASEKNTPAARMLSEAGVTKQRIYEAIEKVRGGRRVIEPHAERRYRALEKYSQDLTSLALEGLLDPVVGREEELNRIAQVLSQRKKNNPLIVGSPGVGKTAIVQGLAQRIATGKAPQILLGKKMIALDFNALLAGARYRGDVEQRVNDVVQEIQVAEEDIVLFIDDLQEHIGRDSVMVLDVLHSAIARGDIQVIAATTVEGYEAYIKPKVLFARSFQPLFVSELSVDQTIAALEALRPAYEEHHQLTIADEAIEAAVRLSDRYIKDRYQPDKSIQIIDEAAAALRLVQLKLPPSLQAKQTRLEKLQDEEESAWSNRDYERAADTKIQRLELEAELEKEIDEWQKKSGIPVKLTREEILNVLSRSTGLPKEKLISEETPLSDLVRLSPVSEVEASTEDLRLGERFRQKYEILELIGRGGFGEVWKVRNKELDRVEAIKVLPPGLIQTRRLAERFHCEAQMAAKLNYPNIVTIYDTGEEAGRRYISMEYIAGPNLAQIIDQRGKLPVEEVQALAIQICAALNDAHQHRVVHRDIKPSNILLDGSLVKVADFGVSVIIKETATELTGMGGGTPCYRAPEQIRGWNPDVRTDIYSLGVTLYELLTGERPFHGTSVEYQHLNETPLPPSHLNWEVPPSVDEIILRCLEKNPIDRFQTAAELRAAWAGLPEPVPITPLVNLMRARLNSKEPPYVLVLGEGASLSSGCTSVVQMVDTIVTNIGGPSTHLLPRHEKLQYFFDLVQGLSPTERYSLLKRHYEGVEPSIGYISLAKLIKAGYFDTIFTTNFDVMLEEVLRRTQVPIQDYRILVVEDEHSMPAIREALKHPTPRIKIVKLHGDINARKFAFTPQEIFALCDALEEVLAEYLLGDVILVGHEMRDEDITRCFGREGGSLWYVHPNKPSPDSVIARIPRLARSPKQLIWGDNGHFDRFFALLCRELLGEEETDMKSSDI